MSLRDGTAKMSKSAPSDASRINLTDSDEAIAKKLKRAKTDGETGFSIDSEKRPEKTNLLTIFAAVSGEPIEALAGRYASASAAQFKGDLTDALIARLSPMRAEITRLLADPGYVEGVLADGAAAARGIASETMEGVRAVAGLAPPLPATRFLSSREAAAFAAAAAAQGAPLK